MPLDPLEGRKSRLTTQHAATVLGIGSKDFRLVWRASRTSLDAACGQRALGTNLRRGATSVVPQVDHDLQVHMRKVSPASFPACSFPQSR